MTHRAARDWLPVLAAAAISAWCVMRLAMLPVEDLATFVPDDAFFYLVLGENLTHAGRLTFDGLNPASGFHPGWLVFTTLLAALQFEGIDLLRAAIATAFALHVVSALVIIRVFREGCAGDRAPWLGALWLANPLSLRLVVQAMESALFVAVLSAAVLVLQRIFASPAPHSKDVRLASVLFGVLCLVRTDGIITAGVGMAAIAVASYRARTTWRGLAAMLAVLAAGPLVALSGFALILKLATGSAVQASGEIKALWGSLATGADRAAFFYHVAGRLTFGHFGTAMFGLPTKLSGIAGAAALVLTAVTAIRRWRVGKAAAPLLTSWLLASALVAIGAFALLLHDYRVWYAGLPLAAMLWALGLEFGHRGKRRSFLAVAAIILLAQGAEQLRLARTTTGKFPYARAIYLSVPIFDRLVPASEPIASFDAGLRGFFSEHRVINLDGLVNERARQAWKTGTLDRYIADEGIHYIADEPRSLDFARRFSPLPEVHAVACVAARPFNERCLWRIVE